MTRNDRLNKLKHGLIVLLALICALSATLFTLSACGKSGESVTDPTYTYSDKDDSEFITNSKFSYNLKTKLYSDFPVASPSGWSKSTENSTSSTVNSGVVDTSEDGWNELLTTLYKDSDFVSYVRNAYRAEVIAAMDKENPTDSDMNTFIKEHKGYDGENVFPANPAREGGDKYVYMLNNYAKSEDYGYGTAQKVTSSSTVTVGAGETYKITFWVKTLNLTATTDESPLANVRITNSFSGNSQAEYRIENIDTDGEWKQYTIYVEGDADYASSFSIVLALGRGGKDSDDGRLFTEGTVYFDDVIVSKLEANEEIPAAAVKSIMAYGGKDAIIGNGTASSTEEYAYSMVLESSIAANLSEERRTVAFNANADFTKSNITENGEYITSKTITADSSVLTSITDGQARLTLKNASATLSVKDGSADFTVGAKSYTYATFYLKNLLNKLGNTTVTVDVYDRVNGGEYKKTAAAATYSTVGEDAIKCELLFKNNFASGSREFYFDIVVGPTDIATANLANLASGEIYLSDLEVVSGKIDSADYENESDNPAYKLYSFFSSKADATVALYSGYNADYSEPSDTESYDISVAPGNVGEILFHPTAPKNFYGITANHIYVKEQTGTEVLDTLVNERVGKEIEAGKSYAGLINSKYLEAYNSEALASALGLDEEDEDIQPIVIYNATKDHYGFIGTKNSVSASSYAKVTVTLRVVGDASAYVYLTDVAGKHKEVMELTENVKGNELATTHKLQRVITSDMMQKGWLTVEFYVATGASSRDFRVEVWNGSRENSTATASEGYVFIQSVSVSTSSAFTEPTSKTQAFVNDSNPLGAAGRTAIENGKQVTYTRELTDTEKKFNKEYPDQKVEYKENYIWAETNSMVYAIFNTIDPVESNPYNNISDDSDKDAGCSAQTDSSTFWLQFSTILLAVVLVLAIIALIVKNVHAKNKANKSDAKSHYTVKSRIQGSDSKKTVKVKKEKAVEKEETEEATAENAETVKPETTEEKTETETENVENQNLDEYVYGDVQDFGDAVTNEDKPEEDSSEENK